MSESPWRIAPLGAEHDRDSFHCGEEALDRYIKTKASQDIRRRVANCFVVVETNSAETGAAAIAAYYTLAATGLPFVDLPPEESKRLPRYPTLPGVRIGRLAVDQRFQGRGLGGMLILDAARRCMHAEPAIYALVVDAKDDRAVAFYEHCGFRAFVSQRRTLYLPMATAIKALMG
jgi:GNAT superfamily N-acetyltransferase